MSAPSEGGRSSAPPTPPRLCARRRRRRARPRSRSPPRRSPTNRSRRSRRSSQRRGFVPLLGPLFGAALTLSLETAARAQAADTALAEQLFEDGQRLMAEGKLDAGCAKLAESHRIDPKLGTLLNLATCHERHVRLSATTPLPEDAATATTTGGARIVAAVVPAE